VNATPDPTEETDRCYSVRRLARYWCCSTTRIREYVRTGVLRGAMIGRAMRFTPEDVAEAWERLTAPTSRKRRRRAPSGIDPRVRTLLGLDDGDT
jgi:excisionase family DNA binding protein